MHFTLVRSPRALIKQHQIGYGWASVDFSAHKSIEDLFKVGLAGKKIGRKGNQIKRYFNLKSEDIVVVPLSGAVAFAVVEGIKSHTIDKAIKHGENRISVNYLTDKDGNVAYMRRKDLSTRLETRLRIRTSIASLDSFQDELEKIVNGLKKHEIYTVSKEITEKREQEITHFKDLLLERLRANKKIWINAGGQGLEEIVQEIFQSHGYDAHIPGKNKIKGVADADVVATKANILTGDVEGTLVQVKHHKGFTRMKGVEQLEAYTVPPETYAYFHKVLITTAEVDADIREKAKNENIKIIDGEALVSWIYDNLDKLSEKNLTKLGVVLEPSLIN